MSGLSDALQSQMYALFKQLDAGGNNDGVVQWNEWFNGLRYRIQGVEERQLRQAFKQIDVNNDGVLEWNEVRQRLNYYAQRNGRNTVNECLKDLVFAEVGTRESRKLSAEQHTNARKAGRVERLRKECDEIAQYNKDVSQSLRLNYQLPSKLTPGYGNETPGQTPGGPRETFGGDNVRQTHGACARGQRRRHPNEDTRWADLDGVEDRLHDARESNSLRATECSYYRRLLKKLRAEQKNIDGILDFHGCMAEVIAEPADDDSVYTGNGNGTGGPGLNITAVDYDRKIITLQNTCSRTQVNAGNYMLECGAGRFHLPRRWVWPKGHHGDKLQIGLGGSKDRHNTDVFWQNVVGPDLAASELQLKCGSSPVGRAIPGYKLARQAPARTPYGAGRGMTPTPENPPEANDRVKIRTTIGVDDRDEPIWKWWHGVVLEVYNERAEALVQWSESPPTPSGKPRMRTQYRPYSQLQIET